MEKDRGYGPQLLHGTPREVLARLMDGDPVGLRQIVAERLRERGLFLAADRVHLRAAARCAREASGWSGRPSLRRWIAGQVDEALDDLVREGGCESLAPFARSLALDPSVMGSALARFNRLDEAERLVFFRALVDGESLDRIAAESSSSITTVARGLRRTLDLFLVPPPARSPRRDSTQRV